MLIRRLDEENNAIWSHPFLMYREIVWGGIPYTSNYLTIHVKGYNNEWGCSKHD
jgi:hypothetical protein